MSAGGNQLVALGLGSNLGDRRTTLRRAIGELEAVVRELLVSPLYETEPQHVIDQPRFLNACCTGHTHLEPRALLEALHGIERNAGRERGMRYGPRTLDIDLLLFGDEVIHEPGLQIPHPRMHERAFVLVPLREILPDWRHPILGRSVRDMAAAASGAGVERLQVDSDVRT